MAMPKPAPVDLRSEPVTAMGLAEVTHAATLCFGMAAAILGHADLDKPNDATFDAAEGLYEGNHVLHRGLGLPSLPINQLLCSVADSADCNANYGIGITATHCHQIAWRYGQYVLGILNHWNVVGTCEGQVVTDRQQFRQKWGDIRHSLQALPRIEYAKFLAAFDREAARAQTLLRTSPASATTRGAKPVKRSSPKRRKPLIEPSLTEKQLEAVHIVGECKGDIAEAARRLGKDRSTIAQHYKAASAKLGKQPVKHSTKRYSTDRRGQADIVRGDDKRL